MSDIVIALSGGETSAYMAIRSKLLNQNALSIFANTGQENEETLNFINYIDMKFDLGVVWVEAVTHIGERKGCTHKVVNYQEACRDGAVFYDMCKKYGVPNKHFIHCTRELKENPIKSYLNELYGSWRNCVRHIGIRADEIDRISPKYKENGLYYPLAFDEPITKIQINEFWQGQERRLNLKQYQGNCKWCYKKTLRKHLTMISETPEYYDFPKRLEVELAHIKPKKGEASRKIFRGERTVQDLIDLAKEPFEPFHDEARVYCDSFLDKHEGCSESCEPFQ